MKFSIFFTVFFLFSSQCVFSQSADGSGSGGEKSLKVATTHRYFPIGSNSDSNERGGKVPQSRYAIEYSKDLMKMNAGHFVFSLPYIIGWKGVKFDEFGAGVVRDTILSLGVGANIYFKLLNNQGLVVRYQLGLADHTIHQADYFELGQKRRYSGLLGGYRFSKIMISYEIFKYQLDPASGNETSRSKSNTLTFIVCISLQSFTSDTLSVTSISSVGTNTYSPPTKSVSPAALHQIAA